MAYMHMALVDQHWFVSRVMMVRWGLGGLASVFVQCPDSQKSCNLDLVTHMRVSLVGPGYRHPHNLSNAAHCATPTEGAASQKDSSAY